MYIMQIVFHNQEPRRSPNVRRSTGGEYNYAIRDLSGLGLGLGIDASNIRRRWSFHASRDVQWMRTNGCATYSRERKLAILKDSSRLAESISRAGSTASHMMAPHTANAAATRNEAVHP